MSEQKLIAAHARIHAFAREHKPGGCRLLSSECTCPLCDADALLGAALASQDMEQRAGWMPIETAPKDGTRVLLAEDGWVGEAQYDTHRQGWCVARRLCDT